MERVYNNLGTYPWILPLILFVVLMVLGATAHPLWIDEAETAFFAKMIVKTGLPMGFDGVNMSAANEATVLNKELVNHVTPPFQYYTVAASFWLLGQSAFTARLPFILFGIASFILLYYVCLKLTGKRSIALITVIIYSLCVPLILFSHQARYYSAVIFSGILLFYSCLVLIEKPRRVWPYFTFVLAGLIYVYSHYLTFLFFYPALYFSVLLQLVNKREWSQVRTFTIKYVLLSLVIVVLFLPWYYSFKPSLNQSAMTVFSFDNFYYIMPFSILEVLAYAHSYNIFPFLFFGLFTIVLIVKKYRKENLSIPLFVFSMPFFYLFFLGIFSAIVSANYLVIFHSRYNLILFPFFILLVAIICYEIARINKYLAGIFLLSYLLTSIYRMVPPSLYRTLPPHSLILAYIQEVTNPYVTSDEMVAQYLKDNATDGETVFLNYDRSHESLIFLLGDGRGGYVKELKFVNRVSPFNTRITPARNPDIPKYLYNYMDDPDWVILYSKHVRETNIQFIFDIRDPNVIGRSKKLDLKNDYTETLLPVFFVSDIARPELEWRTFKKIVPNYQDQVFIYKKKDVSSADEKK